MLRAFGEIAKENCLVKVMSKPLEGDQVSMVPLHGKLDGEKARVSLLWMADMEECDVIGSKMESNSTKARPRSEICIECCSRLPPNPQ